MPLKILGYLFVTWVKSLSRSSIIFLYMYLFLLYSRVMVMYHYWEDSRTMEHFFLVEFVGSMLVYALST